MNPGVKCRIVRNERIRGADKAEDVTGDRFERRRITNHIGGDVVVNGCGQRHRSFWIDIRGKRTTRGYFVAKFSNSNLDDAVTSRI